MKKSISLNSPRHFPHAGSTLAALAAALLAASISTTAMAQASRTTPQAAAQPPLPTTKLTIGLNLVTAELANDARSRQLGLMFRKELAPNHGMLFTFEAATIHCMWMRNTLIPLSVAFIDDEGRIVNVEDMTPHDETQHCARQPARYALEMSQGWFAQRKIVAGQSVRGLPKPQQ